MEEVLATLWGYLTSAGIKIVYAGLILFAGLKLTNIVCRRFRETTRLKRLDDSLHSFLNSLISITLRILVIVSAALALGIPAASFVTVMASAGVAIGLALQGALSNLAGGIMILFFKPFKVGDYIETGAGSGTVHSITVFYTVIMTPDNRQVTLPNGSLTNAAITNCSVGENRRADFVFSVAYASDIDTVKRVLRESAESNQYILREPEPEIWMSKQGSSALEFTMRVWCRGEDYLALLSTANEPAYRALTDAGVSIPYPQMDVHVVS